MSLNKPILAAAIGFSACATSSQEYAPSRPAPQRRPAPVVIIAPAECPCETSANDRPRAGNRKIHRATDNPVLIRQQQMMECILQLDAFLFMECMDAMAASNDCYNDGLEKIVDSNLQYPQCRKAASVRPQGGEEREVAENLCLDRVLANKPQKLRSLDGCFKAQNDCFSNLIKDSSIICTLEEEEAWFGRSK